MNQVEITRGNNPVILGFPHTGTDVPDDVLASLNDRGRKLADTDWHVHRLYGGLLEGVTTVRTKIHRYVIDANRDPAGQSLYPGQNTTTLCPLTDFDGNAIYLDGREPGESQIQHRTEQFHRLYHDALQGELDRIKEIFGFVILFDCHSIRSEVPFLFDARLPDLNVGTNDSTTCDRQLEKAVIDQCRNANGYSHVLNGRFKGGWTTRHYGKPDQNQYAIQMELAQSTYMLEKPPWTYQTEKAGLLRHHLKNLLSALADWRPS